MTTTDVNVDTAAAEEFAVLLALDGDGLGTVWGTQTAVRMLQEAGFTNVEVKELEADPMNSYYICTR